MKKKIILPVLFLLVLASAKAQTYDVIVNNKNKYGILRDGKELVKPRYSYISRLIDNKYFIVEGKDGFGVIDTAGKTLLPEVYDALDYFSNDIFQAKQNGKWGLVNRYNYVSLPFEYTRFNFISDDIAEVWDGNKVGYLSQYGVIVVPPLYDTITKFTPLTYLVSKNGKYGILDDMGKPLLQPSYDEIVLSSDKKYYDIKSNGLCGKMNTALQVVLSPEYDSIKDSPLGMELIQGNKIGFYTPKGKLIKPKYTKVVFLQPEFGLAVVSDGNRLGFVSSTGTHVEPVYENISRFSDQGVAFVEKGGKLMAVTIDGSEITVQEVMGKQQSGAQPKQGSRGQQALPQQAYPF